MFFSFEGFPSHRLVLVISQFHNLGVIQVLRNAGGGYQLFPGKSVTKVQGSILALRGGGWGSNFQKKGVT